MDFGDNRNADLSSWPRRYIATEHSMFVPVAIPRTLAESQELKLRLEEHEIPTLLENEQTALSWPDPQQGGLAVLVPEPMFEHASELVMGYAPEALGSIDGLDAPDQDVMEDQLDDPILDDEDDDDEDDDDEDDDLEDDDDEDDDLDDDDLEDDDDEEDDDLDQDPYHHSD